MAQKMSLTTKGSKELRIAQHMAPATAIKRVRRKSLVKQEARDQEEGEKDANMPTACNLA